MGITWLFTILPRVKIIHLHNVHVLSYIVVNYFMTTLCAEFIGPAGEKVLLSLKHFKHGFKYYAYKAQELIKCYLMVRLSSDIQMTTSTQLGGPFGCGCWCLQPLCIANNTFDCQSYCILCCNKVGKRQFILMGHGQLCGVFSYTTPRCLKLKPSVK